MKPALAATAAWTTPPFGGGAGMVMRPDVVATAIAQAADGRPLLYLTPRGRPFRQADATRLAASNGAILLCGRYEASTSA